MARTDVLLEGGPRDTHSEESEILVHLGQLVILTLAFRELFGGLPLGLFVIYGQLYCVVYDGPRVLLLLVSLSYPFFSLPLFSF